MHSVVGEFAAAPVPKPVPVVVDPIIQVGLMWRWTLPGLFAVPPIGVLGWGIFTFWAVWQLEAWRVDDSNHLRRALLTLVIPPVLLHAVLIAVSVSR